MNIETKHGTFRSVTSAARAHDCILSNPGGGLDEYPEINLTSKLPASSLAGLLGGSNETLLSKTLLDALDRGYTLFVGNPKGGFYPAKVTLEVRKITSLGGGWSEVEAPEKPTERDVALITAVGGDPELPPSYDLEGWVFIECLDGRKGLAKGGPRKGYPATIELPYG